MNYMVILNLRICMFIIFASLKCSPCYCRYKFSQSYSRYITKLLDGKKSALASLSSCHSTEIVTDERVDDTNVFSDNFSAPFQDLVAIFDQLDVSSVTAQNMINHVVNNMGLTKTSDLLLVTKAFHKRPEIISSMLQTDFKIPALESHLLRCCIEMLLSQQALQNGDVFLSGSQSLNDLELRSNLPSPASYRDDIDESVPKKSYKKLQLISRKKSGDTSYGFSASIIKTSFLQLHRDLTQFEKFMTEQNPLSQEAPIRKATADVYLRHARLFCGWWWENINHEKKYSKINISLLDIFPNKKEKVPQPYMILSSGYEKRDKHLLLMKRI